MNKLKKRSDPEHVSILYFHGIDIFLYWKQALSLIGFHKLNHKLKLVNLLLFFVSTFYTLLKSPQTFYFMFEIMGPKEENIFLNTL